MLLTPGAVPYSAWQAIYEGAVPVLDPVPVVGKGFDPLGVFKV